MNRTRFHDILHGNSETNTNIHPNIMVFPIKQLKEKEKSLSLANGTFGLANGTFGLANGTFGLEEKDKVDILYDISYNYFSAHPWTEEKDENIHLSEIYVGDYQEKDIYFTNPLLSSSSSSVFES